eukprot:gene35908-46618_t
MAQPVPTPSTASTAPYKDRFHSTTPSSPSFLDNETVESVDDDNLLGELCKHLATNVRLKETIDQILTDSTPEQISYENKELLSNNIELALNSAKEEVYSNPAAAGMTVDEIAAIKMYTMAADPASS